MKKFIMTLCCLLVLVVASYGWCDTVIIKGPDGQDTVYRNVKVKNTGIKD